MPEEENEALDESDFYENVAEAHRDEVKQGDSVMLRPTSAQCHGKNQKRQHGHHGNNQHHAQNGHAEVYLPVHALLQALLVKHLVELDGEEKEGGVVADGSDVIGILPGESVRIIARNQGGERVVAWS